MAPVFLKVILSNTPKVSVQCEVFLQMLFRKPIGETMRDFRFNLVKIIPLKSNNCVLALRKRLFCDAKPTLLPCKTAAFGMQNNRFCNALIIKLLRNSYACEKYLHFRRLLFAYKTSCAGESCVVAQRAFAHRLVLSAVCRNGANRVIIVTTAPLFLNVS